MISPHWHIRYGRNGNWHLSSRKAKIIDNAINTQDTHVENRSVPERISKEIDRSSRKTSKELKRWKKKLND